MKSFIVFISIIINFITIKAAPEGNCGIKGISDYEWGSYYPWSSKVVINDDHDGSVETFSTTNIEEIIEIKSEYLTATYEEGVLTLYTTERFKQFEEEYGDDWIIIDLRFNCANGNPRGLKIKYKVKDVNNHDPIFDREVYEYNFGTPLPPDFDLTKFLPISATDDDFTNDRIYFSIEVNENFRIKYESSESEGNYPTTLKTLKEIKAPFREEFTISATDRGTPSRQTTALLVVNVISHSKGGDENDLHPPVFSKHLYFANYTQNDELLMTEDITIKYGAQSDTVLKQSGYEKYFKIQLDTSTPEVLHVKHIRSLPKNIQEETNPLVIEIEAENRGLHMKGRTALIIRLTSHNAGDNSENSKECHFTIKAFYEDSILPLVIYLCLIFIMVVANIAVLAWYFQSRNLNQRVEQVPYAINEIIHQEKIKI